MNSPHYFTKTETIIIDGANDLIIRSLLDRQQYYDPTGAAERLGICSASWSLFGMLWPSSIHLASALALRPVNADEHILEIGCGLALASLVAHRRGANITASDRHPKAKSFLQENLRLNKLDKLPFRHGQWGVHPTPSLADTGAALLYKKYDLIVGSDLLYEPDMPLALALFINLHAAKQAEVWIVDPNRGYRPAFNRNMQTLGFELSSDNVLTETASNQENYRGRLLIYKRA
ncbi:SAM-dependent methyltransferase [Pseudomonas sp. C27(2019)]|uniref:class I SAM-dependent methyltransferase n=1 Tax=Pseudomonas sp. C27(2019) TaxID=2604941 RepID=UPI0012445E8A|nr:SAM-dependent methyltransferase [Pseudomonas sp. C27(2019)]QEY58688.1 SAM-dependent methyltransferase [Pseudomonas sp. C27(2019)]